MQVPCGQCLGCRIIYRRSWAIRCMHEASLYDRNCFITLTYSDQHIPKDGSLKKSHFQKFMKRLRKRFAPRVIRFFHCGEYGDTTQRPHYHAILFNHQFDDLKLFSRKKSGNYYTSQTLSQLWPFGHSMIGDVTFSSASYVAGYIFKKVNGAHADQYYQGKQPEYCTMSRRPGIAYNWFKQFKTDVYPHDMVVSNGIEFKPPRYYDLQLSLDDPVLYGKIKSRRVAASSFRTDEELEVAAHVKYAQHVLYNNRSKI